MEVVTWIIRLLTRFSIAAIAIACVAVAWRKCGALFRQPICSSHGGFTHPAFEEVKDTYVQNIMSGFDKGSSFAVYRNGEALVDLWGGCADEDNLKPWEKDTLSQAWSTTKGVTAMVLATLVDKGRLNVNQRVAHYWPEFAQNGKENITVGLLCSHQAGLSHLERRISLREYRDNWTSVEQLLAKQAPLWEPGKLYFYHAFTWGMYADALIRKVDEKHRNASQYFQEEIADKLGGLDFFIGLPSNHYNQSTRGRYITMWTIYAEILSNPENWLGIPNMVKYQDIIHSAGKVFHFMDTPWVMDDPEMRSIGLPSSHGFGNARSIATIFDFLANNGTVRGKTLLSSDMASLLSKSFTKDAKGISLPLMSMTALGTALDVREGVVGHRGYGGQIGYADMKHGLAVGYVTNYKETSGLTEDPRATNVLDVFYRCLHKFNRDQKERN